MQPTVKEYALNNDWRATFTPSANEFHQIRNVSVHLEKRNGDGFALEIEGWVKCDGCCDWGFGKEVLVHFCGGKDTLIFSLIFQDAMEIMAV